MAEEQGDRTIEALPLALADQLLEQCCVVEEEVRYEKAQLNRCVDGLSETLLSRTSQLEELAGRLKEFEEVRQAVERLGQIEDAGDRVQDFYGLVAELQGLLGRAEDGLNTQAVAGTEVEMKQQQLQEFKAVESEQVYRIQPTLQHVNAVGQGLIQSAAKHPVTRNLGDPVTMSLGDPVATGRGA